MSSGVRFGANDVMPRAQDLVEQLRPVCQQIAIAGSLRRCRPDVGDIEMVAQPIVDTVAVAGQLDLFGGGTSAKAETISRLDRRLEELAAVGTIYRDRPFTHEKGLWSAKQKKFWVMIQNVQGAVPIQVDLFIVTRPAQWGPVFIIRTGPRDFSKALMDHLNTCTRWQQEEGRLVCKYTHIEAQTPTEESYFNALHLPWIAPKDRSVEMLRRLLGHGAVRRPSKEPRPPSMQQFRAPEKTTTVVNIHSLPPAWKADPRYIYIGRTNKTWGVDGSKWGNPFVAGQVDGNAIQLYREHLMQSPDLLRAIPELVGKTLVCWCKPKPCHGDILADLANQYARGEWKPPAPQTVLASN